MQAAPISLGPLRAVTLTKHAKFKDWLKNQFYTTNLQSSFTANTFVFSRKKRVWGFNYWKWNRKKNIVGTSWTGMSEKGVWGKRKRMHLLWLTWICTLAHTWACYICSELSQEREKKTDDREKNFLSFCVVCLFMSGNTRKIKIKVGPWITPSQQNRRPSLVWGIHV